MVNVSNFFGFFVGVAELVAAIIIKAANKWLKEKIQKAQTDHGVCEWTCETENCAGIPTGCSNPDNPGFDCSGEDPTCPVGQTCTVQPAASGTEGICQIKENDLCCSVESFDKWINVAGWALFGLAAGQVIRFASSRIFRYAAAATVSLSLSLSAPPPPLPLPLSLYAVARAPSCSCVDQRWAGDVVSLYLSLSLSLCVCVCVCWGGSGMS
jgi:hypothetical protein